MKCRFCGEELINGVSFCVKCGKYNGEETARNKMNVSTRGEGDVFGSAKKRSMNLKLVLGLIPVFIVIGILITVLIMLPCEPKANKESGSYNDSITVSFFASKLLPIGNEPQIYISMDGDDYNQYDGQGYNLNQVGVYTYDVYTINAFGIKSAEKHYEYDMDIPKPYDLDVSVSPGSYEDCQDVEIVTLDGSIVYYTTDGSDPTEASSVYDSAIHLESGKTTIKALAVNDNGTYGDVFQWNYEVNLPIKSEHEVKAVIESEQVYSMEEYVDIDVEHVVLEIREEYNTTVTRINSGMYESQKMQNGEIVYRDGECVKAIVVSKSLSGDRYSKFYYYTEDGTVYFAYYEGDDAHRFYFVNNQLVRWRYSAKATKAQDAVNYDLNDGEEYMNWENTVKSESEYYLQTCYQ